MHSCEGINLRRLMILIIMHPMELRGPEFRCIREIREKEGLRIRTVPSHELSFIGYSCAVVNNMTISGHLKKTNKGYRTTGLGRAALEMYQN